MADAKTAIQTQSIDLFSLGMSTDLRKIVRVNRRILRPLSSVQHFDIYPDRLVPKRDWTSDTSGTANKITHYLYFDDTGSTFNLWGLGLTGGNFSQLLKKSGDVITSGWTAVATTTRTPFTGTNSWLFGFNNNIYFSVNSYISKQVVGGAFTETWQGIAGSRTARPVFHPAKNAAYFFIDNNVYQIDNAGTWSGPLLSLNAGQYITGACVYGNYLAIACSTINDNGHSFVYLWDMDTVSNLVAETIDWGRGSIKHIANLFGTLVGITNEQIDISTSMKKGRLVVRVLNGTTAFETNFLTADDITAAPVGIGYFTDGSKLYFPASLPFQAVQRTGMYSVDASGNFAIELYEPTTTSGQRLTTGYRLGQTWYIARSDNNAYTSNSSASFTATSSFETGAYGNKYNSSHFFGANVSHEKIPSGGSVTLKYKLPEDTTWQTMKTNSIVGTRNTEALGTTLKVPFTANEYMFRVESLGTTITGLSFATEPYDTNIYG